MQIIRRSWYVGLIGIIVFVGTAVFAAPSLQLVVDRGAPVLMDGTTASTIRTFLAARRTTLMDHIAGLVFPEHFETGQDLMSKVDSSVPAFVNRAYHCRFLDRIRVSLIGTIAANDLAAITRNATVCVSGDLPPSEQDAWNLQMINFLWSKPWIVRQGKRVNLYDLILNKLGRPDIQNAKVFGWPGVDHFDGTYSNLSPGDGTFLAQHIDLQTVLNQIAGFRLGEDPIALRKISASLADYATGSQGVYFPDVASPLRAMYLGRQVGPADAVDTLVHEFGHILLDEQRTNFSENSGRVFYRKNATLDEACAETLSWITLHDLYSDFPEIEVLHIIKLYGFSQLKAFDNHYVGFGSVLPILLKSPESTAAIFDDLTKTESLSSFLIKYGRPSPLPSGRDSNVLELQIP